MRGLIITAIIIAVKWTFIYSQGFNHTWLIGRVVTVLDTSTTALAGRINFDSNNADTIGENRKLAFRATQANISDANGNFLFASNGCWIMDASGDTMLNGNDLNPGLWANSYCSNTTGMPLPNGNIIIPYPNDTTKYLLFHQVGNFSTTIPYMNAPEVFYSIIDMNLNNGLGGVVGGQKNLIAFSDNLSWGLAACKHANGRDWWVFAIRDSSNTIFKILVTPTGIINISSQTVNMPIPFPANAGQPCFSPDGKKFAYTSGWTNNPAFYDTRIFTFDRCTGNLDSLGYIVDSNEVGFALSFSPNSRYLYHASGGIIRQADTDAPNIAATDTIVATFDGYCYPCPTCCTTFWLMYLAANGKIYISSGAGTIDFTYINSPDNAGISCDVQQHALRLPCYTIRAGLNQPNYYLGCDTTGGCPCLTNVDNLSPPDFKFRVYPNPVSNKTLNIGYLLPQNKGGLFEIFDVTGKMVFKYPLPPWSNEQSFKLPELSNGVYNCVITAYGVSTGIIRVSKKIAVIKD